MTCLFDAWQRQINYLRISVTDHCNLNCSYCSARSVPRLPRSEILSYEELERVVRIAAGMGINKLRLTGGEPLMRPGITNLVNMLSRAEGIDDVSLTTNGVLLADFAKELKKSGLHRVNVSLDTLRADRYKSITGGRLEAVLSGIEAARLAGLVPVKINMVVLRGTNDDEVIDFARKTIEQEWHVRFIEFMPFGASRNGNSETVPTKEIRERIQTLGKLEPYTGKSGNGPARYYRLPGAKGTIGFISPMTEHFCSTCNRLRLTADGHLRPCLLDDDEINIKAALRSGDSDAELERLVQQAVIIKREGHNLNQGVAPAKPMSQIGG